MRANRILAQEELNEENTVAPVTDVVETQDHAETAAELEAAGAEVQEKADAIEEAEGLGDVLEAQAARVDEMAEAAEEPSEASVIAVESFLEFACHRLGSPKPVRLGLENFNTIESKRDRLKMAAEEIRTLNAKREKGLVMAQEGLGDSLKEFFEVAMTNTAKLKARLQAALQLSEGKTGKASGEFEAVWASRLGGAATLTASEVTTTAKMYTKAFGQQGLANILAKMEESVRKGTEVVRSIWFWSNKTEISVLDRLTQELQSEIEKIEQKAPTGNETGAKKVKILSQDEARRLGTALAEMLETDELERFLNKAARANTLNYFWVLFNAGFRVKNNLMSIVPGMTAINQALLGLNSKEEETLAKLRSIFNAEDLAKAREISGRAMRARGDIVTTIKNRNYFANAAIKYIVESATRRETAE